jgi:hypothetical protein
MPETQERTIETRAEFRDAVCATVEAAIARQARTLLWVDPDFAGWPLDEPRLIDALTAWLRQPLRQLVLLAGGFEVLARTHPRFTAWRANWAHAIEARTPTELDPSDLPTLLLDDGPVLLELFDRERLRGRAAVDAAAARAARDRIDAAVQRSQPAWPVRPLGL